jgi:hypothetical protein
MKKITKEICVTLVKSFYKLKIARFWITSVVALLALYSITKNEIVVVCVAAVLLIWCISTTVTSVSKIKLPPCDGFYVVEDEVINFKKRFTAGRTGSGYNHIYTFGTHGKYVIHKSNGFLLTIRTKTEKDIQYIEDLSLESCNKGDRFYLLVSNEEKKIKIIFCFPKDYYGIAEEDFDFVDGKYYWKE